MSDTEPERAANQSSLSDGIENLDIIERLWLYTAIVFSYVIYQKIVK